MERIAAPSPSRQWSDGRSGMPSAAGSSFKMFKQCSKLFHYRDCGVLHCALLCSDPSGSSLWSWSTFRDCVLLSKGHCMQHMSSSEALFYSLLMWHDPHLFSIHKTCPSWQNQTHITAKPTMQCGPCVQSINGKYQCPHMAWRPCKPCLQFRHAPFRNNVVKQLSTTSVPRKNTNVAWYRQFFLM